MPQTFKKAYDNNYKPIMELLEEAVKSEVASRHVKDMDLILFEKLMIKPLVPLVPSIPYFQKESRRTGKCLLFARI